MSRTIFRAMIPQYKFEICREENQPAVVYKSRELATNDRGELKSGGVVYDDLFSVNHFLYDPALYHDQDRNYARKEVFTTEDWSKELD